MKPHRQLRTFGLSRSTQNERTEASYMIPPPKENHGMHGKRGKKDGLSPMAMNRVDHCGREGKEKGAYLPIRSCPKILSLSIQPGNEIPGTAVLE